MAFPGFCSSDAHFPVFIILLFPQPFSPLLWWLLQTSQSFPSFLPQLIHCSTDPTGVAPVLDLKWLWFEVIISSLTTSNTLFSVFLLSLLYVLSRADINPVLVLLQRYWEVIAFGCWADQKIRTYVMLWGAMGNAEIAIKVHKGPSEICLWAETGG